MTHRTSIASRTRSAAILRRSARARAALAAQLLALLAACGGGAPPAEEKKAASAPPSEAVAPTPAGDAVITGKIVYTGAAPARKPISMDATPACARQHMNAALSEDLLVNPDGSLRNTFVWIKDGLPARSWPVPTTRVKIDQKMCVYTPHVAAALVGQEIEFTNSDPTNHNIHPLPMLNREWNVSQPPQGESVVRSFDKPEIGIPVKCNIHPWMRVYVHVVPHGFFALTGDGGTFEIKGLPVGEYTVEAWHEKLGTQELKVTVGAKESKPANFSFRG